MTEIPGDVISSARKAQVKWGIPASITLAQWALESGYGKHMPPNSNNPFGIKARLDAKGKPIQPAVSIATREVYNGKDEMVIAYFRKYASFTEAFDDHARLLAVGKPYQKVKQYLNDPIKYVANMGHIYATDPDYAAKLANIIYKNDLTQYDKLTSNVPAATVTVTAAVATAIAVAPTIHIPSFDWLNVFAGLGAFGLLFIALDLAYIVWAIQKGKVLDMAIVAAYQATIDKVVADEAELETAKATIVNLQLQLTNLPDVTALTQQIADLTETLDAVKAATGA